MTVNRREFLRAGATAGALALTPRWLHGGPAAPDGPSAESVLAGAPITDPTVRELAFRAVAAARTAGAAYADVRLTHTRSRAVDPPLSVREGAQRDAGVRALVDGYWGFAASAVWTPDELARLGREAVHQAKVNALGLQRVVELGQIPIIKDGHWTQPVERDPFQVAESEVLDLFEGLRVYAQRKSRTRSPELKAPGVAVNCQFQRQDKAFASSEGSYCTQRLYRTTGWLQVALKVGGTPPLHWLESPLIEGAGRGWEYIHQAPLREEIERLAEEILADAAIPVKPFEVGRYDVVFDAQSMARLLARTIGCATDLSRALAYRAHEIGTSYLNDPLTMLGSYQVGTPLLTVLADRAQPGGLATVKWDDEGVEPDQFALVKDGVVADFQTHREGAGWLKEAYTKQGRPVRSHGCAAVARAFEAPAIAMPNLTLVPGKEALDFDDLVAGLPQGLAVKQASASTDWQCLNGGAKGRPTGIGVFEVKHGKRVARIPAASFLFRAPEFWRALQALGGTASQRPFVQDRSAYYEPGAVQKGSTVLAVPGVVKQVTTIIPRGGLVHEHNSEPDRLLTEAQCVALAEQIFGFRRGGGEAAIRIVSYWGGELRWGRNRVTLASDRRETVVTIERGGRVETNQLGAAELEAAMRMAERYGQYEVHSGIAPAYLFGVELPTPATWSEATYQLTAAERARVARTLIEPAEAEGLLSAGHLAAEAQAYALLTSGGERFYHRMSQAQCSMTVRDQQGTGSGWAGKSSYDWAKLDTAALAERALKKCLASRHPVALEPGRYTVILEPQAVADLLEMLMGTAAGPAGPRGRDDVAVVREDAESPNPVVPFWQRPGFSKLGLKVADERVTIGYDLRHPDLGTRPAPMRAAANWVEQGVLTNLTYNREYAVHELNEPLGSGSPAFRMQGGETSLDEMIATTRRGLLVTRLWGLAVKESKSLLSTGSTRDGLWLIENGKITKPVKNLSFAASPLIMLNQLEQLGPAEPVFRPGYRAELSPAVVPPLKVRDFNFTAVVDAV